MDRVKTFFIYFILIVVFFIYSQIMIYMGIVTTYKYKNVDIKTTIPIEASVKATSVNGIANITITDTKEDIKGKYLKLECYSKHDTLMGTKYIKIEEINTEEPKNIEIRFNYSKVERAIIDIVEEKQVEEENVKEEDKISDEEMGLAAIIASGILLFFFG